MSWRKEWQSPHQLFVMSSSSSVVRRLRALHLPFICPHRRLAVNLHHTCRPHSQFPLFLDFHHPLAVIHQFASIWSSRPHTKGASWAGTCQSCFATFVSVFIFQFFSIFLKLYSLSPPCSASVTSLIHSILFIPLSLGLINLIIVTVQNTHTPINLTLEVLR